MVTTQKRFKVLRESDLGEIQPYQILDLKGDLVEDYVPDEALSKKMYEAMVFARTFDEKAINMSTLREVGVYAPYSGQEAIQVGAIMALAKDDWYVPMYRDSGAMITKGMPPEKILQHLAGDEFGMQVPQEVKMLPLAISVATQIPHAAGLAIAQKLRKTDAVVYATIGDGGTSKADFHEGLNFAGAFGAPLIVGGSNNQYAISVPHRKQTAAVTYAQKAIGYGIEGILVDGNDVFAVHEAMKYAVERARSKSIPVLIEFYTYRLRMHTTAELVSAKKRDPVEVEEWRQRDPIVRLERFLLGHRIIDEEYRQDVIGRAQQRMRRSIELFRSFSNPDPSNMFRYMYSKITPRLSEQMEEAFGIASTSEPSPFETDLPSGGPQLNMRNALNNALNQVLETDDSAVIFGEDVGFNGGVFQITRGLQERFGVERVFDSPLEELGIAGVFVGLSVAGFNPIAEIQFDGFAMPTLDQLITHIGRFRNRRRGRYPVHGIIRFPFGGGTSGLEHHSDSPEVYFAATPGIKVVVPSNPFDAKGS